MTLRQKLLQAAYPLLMRFSRNGRNGKVRTNDGRVMPPVSFYSLSAIQNTGEELPFTRFRNKKVLLVNTASGCGYTAQYEELQRLYKQHRERLVVLAFPANDFREQEPEGDAEIARFCKIGYGVEFPLMKKAGVRQGEGRHPVYQWLTDPGQNGWNGHQPDWNFAKYLVDEQGRLTHYFGPAVSPLGSEVLRALAEGR